MWIQTVLNYQKRDCLIKARNQQTWKVHFGEKSRIKWTVLPDLQAKAVLPHLKLKIMNMHQKRISNSCLCQSQEKRKMNLTITIHFIRFILAVNFSITPQVRINTLSFLTLELRCRAYWTTILIALVITLREPITPPCHWDTVNLSSCTGKLVWGASWRFWRKRKQNTCAHSFNF